MRLLLGFWSIKSQCQDTIMSNKTDNTVVLSKIHAAVYTAAVVTSHYHK